MLFPTSGQEVIEAVNTAALQTNFKHNHWLKDGRVVGVLCDGDQELGIELEILLINGFTIILKRYALNQIAMVIQRVEKFAEALHLETGEQVRLAMPANELVESFETLENIAAAQALNVSHGCDGHWGAIGLNLNGSRYLCLRFENYAFVLHGWESDSTLKSLGRKMLAIGYDLRITTGHPVKIQL